MLGCTPGKRFVQLLATLNCEELTVLGAAAAAWAGGGAAAPSQAPEEGPAIGDDARAFRSVIELSGCESSEKGYSNW